MNALHTPGPWTDQHPYSTPDWASVPAGESHGAFDYASLAIGQGNKIIGVVQAQTNAAGFPQVESLDEMRANARLIAAAPDLLIALSDLADVFAHDGENSVARFDRLAAMFRKDTGYLAPGKDQPMCGPDQPDGDELRAIYDAWYLAKVTRAREAITQATAA
jgi:hypothetical protein